MAVASHASLSVSSSLARQLLIPLSGTEQLWLGRGVRVRHSPARGPNPPRVPHVIRGPLLAWMGGVPHSLVLRVAVARVARLDLKPLSPVLYLLYQLSYARL